MGQGVPVGWEGEKWVEGIPGNEEKRERMNGILNMVPCGILNLLRIEARLENQNPFRSLGTSSFPKRLVNISNQERMIR